MATRRSSKRAGKRTTTAEADTTAPLGCLESPATPLVARALLKEPRPAPSAGRLDADRGIDASVTPPLDVVVFFDDEAGLHIERTLRGGRIVKERAIARNGDQQ